jgi:hypothetical protein
MTKFTDDVLVTMIKDQTGEDVSDRAFLSFSDVDASLREDVDAIRAVTKALPDGVSVSGHVYDVGTGEVSEVVPAG